MRKAQNLLFILILLSFLIGCKSAATKQRIYDEQAINNIEAWQIEFTYFHGTQESKQNSTGASEETVTKHGENARDLQFIDDLIFYLRGDHQMNVAKRQAAPSGFIRLHLLSVHWYEGQFFKSASISILNADEELIAQLKCQNGDKLATVKDDDEFAQYVASQLVETLQKK